MAALFQTTYDICLVRMESRRDKQDLHDKDDPQSSERRTLDAAVSATYDTRVTSLPLHSAITDLDN